MMQLSAGITTVTLAYLTAHALQIHDLSGNNYRVVPLISNPVPMAHDLTWYTQTAKQIRALNVQLQAAHQAREDFQKQSHVDGPSDFTRSTAQQRETMGALRKTETDLTIRILNLMDEYNFGKPPIFEKLIWTGSEIK